MRFANATKFDRKSGFAQWRDLRFLRSQVLYASASTSAAVTPTLGNQECAASRLLLTF